jgi:hypothetical protein
VRCGAFARDFTALGAAFAARFGVARRAGRAVLRRRRVRFGVLRAGFERFRGLCAFRLAITGILSNS